MDDFKDRRLKYVDLPRVFHVKANEITIVSKQQLKTCEKLAIHLSKQKPKTPKDFEQNEWLKDFVMKTAKLNEETISLLEYLQATIQEISDDAQALKEGASALDVIRDQQDTIKCIQQVRDNAVQAVYELRKN